MIKTFILGLILGLVGAAALVYSGQLVDLSREASLISVRPNGGNRESFYINLPQDRILAGAQSENQSEDQSGLYPPGLVWPDDPSFKGAETEIFKIRNSDDVVVGIAARMSNARDASGAFIQWMLHLPARGSMFVRMQLQPSKDGHRKGLLMAGTREFELLNGEVGEFYNSAVANDEYEISGRLELHAQLVGTHGDDE